MSDENLHNTSISDEIRAQVYNASGWQSEGGWGGNKYQIHDLWSNYRMEQNETNGWWYLWVLCATQILYSKLCCLKLLSYFLREVWHYKDCNKIGKEERKELMPI